jgi:O-acetyl-ADP-ribose deacetylase (regulator of RNase III)
MQLKIIKGDIIGVEVEAIAYPGNTAGLMDDTLGRRIVQLASDDLMREIADRSPIALGASTAIEVSGLQARAVIYTPIVHEIGDRITIENVRKFMRASMVAACHHEYESLALPVIHPNVETMSLTETTRAMMDELRGFKHDHDLVVYFVDGRQGVLDTLTRSLDPNR